ncbi:MAG: DUF192 domain-containing protein [Paracoccaceae bacterium]|nr:DUF192 domain-containing protein [Paracoccaceae bacterium]
MIPTLAAAAIAACHAGSALIRPVPAPAVAQTLRPIELHLETAVTEAERERGLMDRHSLPANSGMIFVFGRPQTVYFWMKDTPIPLDMVFLSPTGTVVGTHENAVPEDRTVISSPAGVQYVIEVAGGAARRLGLIPGASVVDWTCK